MVIVFVIGYLMIALEQPLKIFKTPTALLLAALLWTITAVSNGSAFIPSSLEQLIGSDNPHGLMQLLTEKIKEELGSTCETVFFLVGAMCIVEVMDTWGAFRIITDRIKSRRKVRLLWILGILTFFMSAILDNLTTTIVMLALLNKIIKDRKDRWFFAGIIVVSANAGGAWTPIGDVTTIMLWIQQKVSAVNVIEKTFLASLISVVVPFTILSFILKGDVESATEGVVDDSAASRVPLRNRYIMLFMGVILLLFVPVFKAITHLPPYLGMLASLSVLWIVTDALRPSDKSNPDRQTLRCSNIIHKVDYSSILFFLGILMAVAALNVCGHLTVLSENLDKISLAEPQKYFFIDTIIGMLSSVVDNVPLVAASMSMYDFQMDHYFWELLAYCAGTGGSLLIIGSAAGVAAMGIEKMDFIWYLKHISWIALIGYLSGVIVYILQYEFIG